jgi:hypothetical protein
MADGAASTRSVLFVAGTARSGTSALTDLLNAHPAIVIGQERYFNLVSPGAYDRLTPDLFDDDRFLHPTPDETHNHQWRDNGEYVAHLRDKLRRARIVGDKVPNYFARTEMLFERFPGSRMLLITRDPVRVADSWKRRMLDPADTTWHAGPEKAIEQWNIGQGAMLYLCQTLPDRVGMVVYERLFGGDARGLERLCDWLGAGPPDEHMYECFGRATADWSARVTRPFVLTPAERAHVERTARHDVRRDLLTLAITG